MAKAVVCSPLSDRLAEVIDEFSEANSITFGQVLDALDLVKATVERFRDQDDYPPEKLH